MNVAEKFGKNVQRARKRAGLGQEAVAVHASLHRTEVSAIERGERLVRIDTLIKVASALSVPPGDLLKGIAWLSGRSRPGDFRLSGRD